MTLFNYAYCGNFSKKLPYLAELTKEKWSFRDKNDLKILENYIFHTFSKVYDEKKVIETKDYAIFNTGLFDSYYTPIYCCFTLNNRTDTSKKWYLSGFYNEFNITKIGIIDLPERANYFSDPSDLVFDISLDIIPQYDHIFGEMENLMRFPETLQDDIMKKQLFDGALKTTKNMLAANYKIAVPQYYNSKLQLLVPICLENPQKPDLALTCEKTPDKTKYLASTCLTLEMAYNNARLIAKPESNWLTI